MPVRPEDFGGVPMGGKTDGPRPEDFGGVAVGNVSQDETGGMIMPTDAQLAARKLRGQPNEVPLPKETGIGDIADYFRRRLIAAILPSMPAGNVPMWARAGESLKMTPQGKAGFIRDTNQASQPPLRGPNGEVMVFDDRTGEYVPFNKPGLDAGDLAGMAGPAVEAAPNVIGSILAPGAASNPLAQGGLAAGGNVLRQGVSGLLPGNDELSLLDRAKEAGTAGLWAGGTQAAVNVGAAGFDYLRPTNIIGRKYRAALDTPLGKQGADLTARTGATMDAAEATQDPALLRYRNTALQSDEGQTLARNMNNAQLGEQRTLAEQSAQRSRTDVTAKRMDAEQVGPDFEKVRKKELGQLYDIREYNADANYGDVINAVKSAGRGRTEIEVSDLRKAMEAAEEAYPGITKALRETNRFLSKAERGPKSEFADIEDVIRLEKRLRSIESQKGSLNPTYDVGQNKQVAGDLHDALVSSLKKSQQQVGQDAYGKLRGAIDAYRSDSDAIRKVAGIKLGDAATPEGLAESIRTAEPSQLKQIFSLADEHDPLLRQKATEYLFRSSIDKAKNRVLSPSGQVPFNRNTFLNEMGIGEEKLSMLTRGNPQARQAVDDVIELVKRTNKSSNLGNATANVGSDVASGAMVMTNILSGDPKAGILWGGKFLAKNLTGPIIAKIMFQPEGQAALRTLVKTNPGSKAYAGALAYVARVAGKEPSDRSVGQQLEPQQ